jgi:hypothetical protein
MWLECVIRTITHRERIEANTERALSQKIANFERRGCKRRKGAQRWRRHATRRKEHKEI